MEQSTIMKQGKIIHESKRNEQNEKKKSELSVWGKRDRNYTHRAFPLWNKFSLPTHPWSPAAADLPPSCAPPAFPQIRNDRRRRRRRQRWSARQLKHTRTSAHTFIHAHTNIDRRMGSTFPAHDRTVGWNGKMLMGDSLNFLTTFPLFYLHFFINLIIQFCKITILNVKVTRFLPATIFFLTIAKNIKFVSESVLSRIFN